MQRTAGRRVCHGRPQQGRQHTLIVDPTWPKEAIETRGIRPPTGLATKQPTNPGHQPTTHPEPDHLGPRAAQLVVLDGHLKQDAPRLVNLEPPQFLEEEAAGGRAPGGVANWGAARGEGRRGANRWQANSPTRIKHPQGAGTGESDGARPVCGLRGCPGHIPSPYPPCKRAGVLHERSQPAPISSPSAPLTATPPPTCCARVASSAVSFFAPRHLAQYPLPTVRSRVITSRLRTRTHTCTTAAERAW